MATKLKNLSVTSVDLVDQGANPDAHVRLFKRGDQGTETDKDEGIIRKFLAWIRKGYEDATGGDVDNPVGTVEKDASTFGENISRELMRAVTSEMFDCCYALSDSLCSIICDNSLDTAAKQSLMNQSLDEFSQTVRSAAAQWAAGKKMQDKPDGEAAGIQKSKAQQEALEKLLGKYDLGGAEPTGETQTAETGTIEKEVTDTMKIDKSKMTPEEVAALEAIEKKAGIPDEPTVGGDTPPVSTPALEPAPTAKAAPAPAPAAPVADDGGEDIYKGLHPAVRAELERLRKQADAAEERELQEVAKKYEIIGKKAEELVPLLKSLKAAGGDAYAQMITVLDASVAAVEKSGIFSEIGKSGGAATSSADGAWAQIEKHAETIQKAAPTLTWAEAVDKACEQHPDLVHEYESGR